ncbi:MAG: uncharacterized protein QOJ97_1653 [Solirubrobacteraceae bacterium]|jgi:Fe-S-cluster containining protein|nr:uncharacterized protein [Solirubrobacteraceae bacterium]
MGSSAKRRGRKPDRAQRAAIEAKLGALYAELPALECKGRCVDSCLSIDMTPAERNRLRRAGAPEIPPLEPLSEEPCPLLENGRCTVHELRPLICRLWGLTENMVCPYGCIPKGGHLTHAEFEALMIRSYHIGGWPAGVPRSSPKRIHQLLSAGALAADARRTGSAKSTEQEERGKRPVGARVRRLWSRQR